MKYKIGWKMTNGNYKMDEMWQINFHRKVTAISSNQIFENSNANGGIQKIWEVKVSNIIRKQLCSNYILMAQ